MSIVCTRASRLFHSYVLVFYLYVRLYHLHVSFMYLYVICMSLVCNGLSLVCTRISLVCHLYVTRMSSVCHLYVLVCHLYVIRMWFYNQPWISSDSIQFFQELTGFHMEKAFTEKEFQTNYSVCVKKLVIKASWVFKYSISLKFSGATKQKTNCVRSKQIPRKKPAK